MAAIAITDCTVRINEVGGLKWVYILTPATADHTNTIDVSTLFGKYVFAVISSATDKSLLATATAATGLSITLPGATADEARTISAWGE